MNTKINDIEKVHGFYYELDVLFDTRLATLEKLNKEVAEKLVDYFPYITLNDLEEVVLKQNSQMNDYISNIKKIVDVPVIMSGSGSCIIIYSGHKKVARRLKKIYPNCVVGRFKIIDKGE